jgi:hypothetical protein
MIKMTKIDGKAQMDGISLDNSNMLTISKNIFIFAQFSALREPPQRIHTSPLGNCHKAEVIEIDSPIRRVGEMRAGYRRVIKIAVICWRRDVFIEEYKEKEEREKKDEGKPLKK